MTNQQRKASLTFMAANSFFRISRGKRPSALDSENMKFHLDAGKSPTSAAWRAYAQSVEREEVANANAD
jgi:hypothetical protein